MVYRDTTTPSCSMILNVTNHPQLITTQVNVKLKIRPFIHIKTKDSIENNNPI